MPNKSPFFSVQPPHHFTDYGFEPQIDYFQVLLTCLSLHQSHSFLRVNINQCTPFLFQKSAHYIYLSPFFALFLTSNSIPTKKMTTLTV